MITPPPLWGFFGLFAGPWKFVIIAAVGLAFYGRRISPLASRWLSPTSRASFRKPQPVSRYTFGDKVYLFLLVLAATTLATWIISHALIAQSAHVPR